uniref:Uncharacterized protein n=1 Tax=uncultured marine virus TaxID=186617 RepID=A0A0F7L3V5_9VIRU|nr:hypothetical protein [uncultured marine virus]
MRMALRTTEQHMNLIAFHSFDQPERMVYVNPAHVFAVDAFIDGAEELGTRIMSSHRGMVVVLESVADVVGMLTS